MAKKKASKEKSGSYSADDVSPVLVCTPKRLPAERMIEAADHACSVNPHNSAPVHRLTRIHSDFVLTREHLAVVTNKYWGIQGVRLSVGFLDGESATLRRLILQHLNAWSATSNVSFVESSIARSAQVRIARRDGDVDGGYWSFLGTDIELIPDEEPTMNLEGFTANTPESEFRRVVRHEAGHTLGFPHEHMRQELVARIDEAKAIEFFGRTEGWSPEEVRQQVLTPIEESSLLGTPDPDPYSIMCYQISGDLTRDGRPIIGGDDIDAEDRQFAAKIYPKSVSAQPPDLLAPRSGSEIFDGSSHQRLMVLNRLLGVAETILAPPPVDMKPIAGRDTEDAVIRVLNDFTDVPFGLSSSLSANLGINTNGRWAALANALSREIPGFSLSGRALRSAMGPPGGDTVGKLMDVVAGN